MMSHNILKRRNKSAARLKYHRAYLKGARDPSHRAVSMPPIYQVASHYYNHHGERDYEQAFLWFLKGALLGYPECMHGLAQMYISDDYLAYDEECE